MHPSNLESRHYYAFCVLTSYLSENPRSRLIGNFILWNAIEIGAQNLLRGAQGVNEKHMPILLGQA